MKCYHSELAPLDARIRRADPDGYISREDLDYNCNQALEQITTIPEDVLTKEATGMDVLICNSVILEQLPVIADAGTAEFVCYVWDRKRQKYKRVLLAQDIDTVRINSHPKAMELTKLLAGINNEYFAKQGKTWAFPKNVQLP